MDVYKYNGKIYCPDCGAKLRDELIAELAVIMPEGPIPDGGGISDFPQHCDNCEKFVENPLSDKGRKFISDFMSVAARDVKTNRASIIEWAQFYNMVIIDPYHVMDERNEPEYEPEEPEEERPFNGVWSVAIYMVELQFGGSEEGGWWYDTGYPVLDTDIPFPEFTADKGAAFAIRERMDVICAKLNIGRREKSSVLSNGVYEAHVMQGMPRSFPDKRPHYE